MSLWGNGWDVDGLYHTVCYAVSIVKILVLIPILGTVAQPAVRFETTAGPIRAHHIVAYTFADAHHSTNKRIHPGLNYDLGTSTARRQLIPELYIHEEDTTTPWWRWRRWRLISDSSFDLATRRSLKQI